MKKNYYFSVELFLFSMELFFIYMELFFIFMELFRWGLELFHFYMKLVMMEGIILFSSRRDRIIFWRKYEFGITLFFIQCLSNLKCRMPLPPCSPFVETASVETASPSICIPRLYNYPAPQGMGGVQAPQTAARLGPTLLEYPTVTSARHTAAERRFGERVVLANPFNRNST